MRAFFAAEQKRHFPRTYPGTNGPQDNPEQPERAVRLLAGAQEAGCRMERPSNYGLGPIAAVHTPEYLGFLQTVHARWRRYPAATSEVVPTIHPVRRDGVYPASAVGQAGYHMADGACPIGEHTWESVCWSAWSAVAASNAVLDGETAAYALCRPPGHHAFADIAGGFCYINNAAVAAQHLLENCRRVAILDLDLHHGNGTQAIFYARRDVLTVSIHVDPSRFYPFFWGHASERGAGAGLGFNMNLPLPRKATDDMYLDALDAAAQRILAYAPDVLVVALGLDAHEGDPFGGLAVTTPGFARIGKAVASLNLPCVIVQEGGYLSDSLDRNLASFLKGIA